MAHLVCHLAHGRCAERGVSRRSTLLGLRPDVARLLIKCGMGRRLRVRQPVAARPGRIWIGNSSTIGILRSSHFHLSVLGIVHNGLTKVATPDHISIRNSDYLRGRVDT